MFKRILKWLGAITVLRQGLRQQSFVYDSDAYAANPFTRKDISQTEKRSDLKSVGPKRPVPVRVRPSATLFRVIRRKL
jgi:hypothetical protein